MHLVDEVARSVEIRVRAPVGDMPEHRRVQPVAPNRARLGRGTGAHGRDAGPLDRRRQGSVPINVPEGAVADHGPAEGARPGHPEVSGPPIARLPRVAVGFRGEGESSGGSPSDPWHPPGGHPDGESRPGSHRPAASCRPSRRGCSPGLHDIAVPRRRARIALGTPTERLDTGWDGFGPNGRTGPAAARVLATGGAALQHPSPPADLAVFIEAKAGFLRRDKVRRGKGVLHRPRRRCPAGIGARHGRHRCVFGASGPEGVGLQTAGVARHPGHGRVVTSPTPSDPLRLFPCDRHQGLGGGIAGRSSSPRHRALDFIIRPRAGAAANGSALSMRGSPLRTGPPARPGGSPTSLPSGDCADHSTTCLLPIYQCSPRQTAAPGCLPGLSTRRRSSGGVR